MKGSEVGKAVQDTTDNLIGVVFKPPMPTARVFYQTHAYTHGYY